jgi:hypothetical protein
MVGRRQLFAEGVEDNFFAVRAALESNTPAMQQRGLPTRSQQTSVDQSRSRQTHIAEFAQGIGTRFVRRLAAFDTVADGFIQMSVVGCSSKAGGVPTRAAAQSADQPAPRAAPE